MSQHEDLQHFLRLAAAQVGHRAKNPELTEAERNRLRLLEALIKEQLPTGQGHANEHKDTNTAARTTR